MPKSYFVNGSTVTPNWLNKISNPNFEGKDEDGSFALPAPLPLEHIPDLPASQTTSGTFSTARIPSLSASKIGSGTLSADRLPVVPVEKGGTGAEDADNARVNLDAAKTTHTHTMGDITGITSTSNYIILITTTGAGVWTVPYTGRYKIIAVGRGGNAYNNTEGSLSVHRGGGGGGTAILLKSYTQGDTVDYSIGDADGNTAFSPVKAYLGGNALSNANGIGGNGLATGTAVIIPGCNATGVDGGLSGVLSSFGKGAAGSSGGAVNSGGCILIEYLGA
jgi:hypothetical protein